jgi:AraC-like DNA-binding protein
MEFNRGALAFRKDLLYVGSINGLYLIDTKRFLGSYLPTMINKREEKHSITYLWPLLIVVLIMTGLFLVEFYRRKIHSTQTIQPRSKFDLAQVEKDIRTNQLLSVEALAEHYGTNTVQLNRQFKSYNTTPGKFLKKVRMKMARDMMDKNIPLDDIALKVGYSAYFLKKNLS